MFDLNNQFGASSAGSNGGGSSRTSLSSTANELAQELGRASRYPDFTKSLDERREMASEYLKRRNFEVKHQHGQRISTADWWNEETMQKVQWNEVFVGKLPRDLFEDELLPHLSAVAPVGRIRYMMDFSGSNRGYCFAKYATVEDAIRAIRYLDGRLVRANKPPIGAKISFDNKCLYIGNLPLSCTSEQLIRTLRKAEVNGITHVELVGESRPRRPKFGNSQQFGGQQLMDRDFEPAYQFGYVHFESHEAATKARRILIPGEVRIFRRRLTLDWAKSDVPQELLNYMKTGFIEDREQPRPKQQRAQFHPQVHPRQRVPTMSTNDEISLSNLGMDELEHEMWGGKYGAKFDKEVALEIAKLFDGTCDPRTSRRLPLPRPVKLDSKWSDHFDVDFF